MLMGPVIQPIIFEKALETVLDLISLRKMPMLVERGWKIDIQVSKVVPSY